MGIVAASSAPNIVPLLIEGLKKLEYRGYDSAGLTLIGPAISSASARPVASQNSRPPSASTTASTGIAHPLGYPWRPPSARPPPVDDCLWLGTAALVAIVH